jgi:glycosyltransferase involved in cell wall biosynthesis
MTIVSSVPKAESQIMTPSNPATGTPLRILLWHWGRRGAGPRYTLDLTRALGQLPGVETYVSIGNTSELYAETMACAQGAFNIDTYTGAWSALLRSATLPLLRRRFAAYLRSAGIDVVLCTMTHIWNRFFMDVLQQAGVPLVTCLHDASLHTGESNLLRRLLLNQEIRHAARIITLTEYVRAQIIHGTAVPVHVIPHGIFAYLNASPAPRSLRSDRPLRLLFFGRLVAYKGLGLLLDAYSALRATHALELQIVGAGNLQHYASQLKALPEVQVTNTWIDDSAVGSYLEWADLMIVPYIEASQSGVIATAYGAGLPVIVTPVGGLTEQVSHRATGLIAAGVSAAAIADCIVEFVNDPGLYARCSTGACALAQGALTWPKIARQILPILTAAASEPPTGLASPQRPTR